MIQEDKEFMIKFVGVLGLLVLIAVIIFFLARFTVNDSGDRRQRSAETVETRISPIGNVKVAAATAPSVTKSGQEIVEGACQTCHAAGVLQAPVLSDKAAWSTRLESGLQNLISNAINGIRSMPARGGDPSLTDEQVERAVLYMLEQAGVEVPHGSEPEAAATQPVQEVASPPAAIPVPSTSAPAPTAPVATTEQVAPTQTLLERGREIYTSACFACHASGAAGSPRLGDVAAWKDRIAQGIAVLYESAIKGKGTMPAKGGRADLSDEDVSAAVDYMISASQ